MANISNEELREILFPEATKAFLEEHPGCYKRAAKMYAGEAVKYSGKALKHELVKNRNKADEIVIMIESNPSFFPQ
ncbi:hypothetical protein DFP93_102109 [Aneurinibacillus soli]|uniref:Uncharacterized protein n=1 Tax=Aneurinibacillus soli TaxID=1500254 RepID=A0A0U4WFX8_9BACL|nr:hypothetical protein [Aneurinibacillus soli]PYE63425.1 hypothetical protein DFP93_102109 [Aneurinibacillus soli]BAU27643.1 hypothetical protein CB4_01817 [Aneurinibacillus soli]